MSKNNKHNAANDAEQQQPDGAQQVEVTIEDDGKGKIDIADEKESDDEAVSMTPEDVQEVSAEKLQQEIAELKDRNLRLMAEFENYKKRTLREKTELILNGGEKVITALLPILDDLERAEANMNKSQDYASLREGFDLIVKKLHETLERQGLKRINTDGKTFDTDYHEAIAMVPVEDKAMAGHVIDCVEAGYQLGDKVIRHAKVAVGQ